MYDDIINLPHHISKKIPIDDIVDIGSDRFRGTS